MYTWHSEYFCGNKISDYGLENHRVDYATLAKSFDAVLNNNIINATAEDYWETVNGCDYDEETDTYTEIYQYYIIDENGVDILTRYTDEIILYNERLDMYLWCIDHYGTAWSYVLTDIRIEL